MKIIILEMCVVPKMHVFGMKWQLNPKIAPFPELAVPDPRLQSTGMCSSCLRSTTWNRRGNYNLSSSNWRYDNNQSNSKNVFLNCTVRWEVRSRLRSSPCIDIDRKIGRHG